MGTMMILKYYSYMESATTVFPESKDAQLSVPSPI